MDNATFKIILVGDSGVGKSSLLRRYTEDNFNNQEQATVGVDFRVHKCTLGDSSTVNLQIWDTAGQERYRSMTRVYFRAADVIVMVYDITSKESFDNLKYWLDIAKELAKVGVIKYLVGNKLDQFELNNYQVTRNDGLNFARMNNMSFIEVSAKSNIGVAEIFLDCASMLAERAQRRKSLDTSGRQSIGSQIHLQETPAEGTTKSRCSC